jgi:hypothetical protein
MQTTIPCTAQEEIPTNPTLNLTQWLKEARDEQLDYEQYKARVLEDGQAQFARTLERHPLDVAELDGGWLEK